MGTHAGRTTSPQGCLPGRPKTQLNYPQGTPVHASREMVPPAADRFAAACPVVCGVCLAQPKPTFLASSCLRPRAACLLRQSSAQSSPCRACRTCPPCGYTRLPHHSANQPTPPSGSYHPHAPPPSSQHPHTAAARSHPTTGRARSSQPPAQSGQPRPAQPSPAAPPANRRPLLRSDETIGGSGTGPV